MDHEFVTVVSGLPRSGTSMMMRMLDQGGLPVLTDGLRKADDDNPRGYYEFEPVKRLQHDATWLADARSKAVKIIYLLLYHLPKSQQFKILFMNRSLEEVIASQKTMLRHRNEGDRMTDQQLMDSFQEQLYRLDQWIRRQDNLSIRYMDYAEVLAAPATAAADVKRFLGIPLDVHAMARSVEPALHRNRVAIA